MTLILLAMVILVHAERGRNTRILALERTGLSTNFEHEMIRAENIASIPPPTPLK